MIRNSDNNMTYSPARDSLGLSLLPALLLLPLRG
jgi:hypothetical protein